MERDRWEPFEGEITQGERIGIRRRLADLAFRAIEAISPPDLHDIFEEDE